MDVQAQVRSVKAVLDAAEETKAQGGWVDPDPLTLAIKQLLTCVVYLEGREDAMASELMAWRAGDA